MSVPGLGPDNIRRRSIATPASFGCAVLGLAVGGAATAQVSDTTIVLESTCEGCRIVITPTLVVGHRDDEASIVDNRTRLIRDHRGRVYAWSYAVPGEFLVFNANGRFRENVGHEGDGPDQFGVIRALTVDTLNQVHVFHGERYSLLDSTYQLIRATRVPGTPQSAAVVAPDSVVVAGRFHTPESSERPLHLLVRGRLSRSYGTVEPAASASPFFGMEHVAVARDMVWSGRFNVYALSGWDLDGGGAEVLLRQVDWFRPWTPESFTPGVPQFGPSMVDGDGALWTTVVIPDPGGASGSAVTRGRTVLEVIDPGSARILASVRLDVVLYGFLDEQSAYTLQETDEGLIVAQVFDISLRN